MGPKTPISLNLRKYAEKQRPVVSAQQNTKKWRAATQTTLFRI